MVDVTAPEVGWTPESGKINQGRGRWEAQERGTGAQMELERRERPERAEVHYRLSVRD